MRSKNKAENTDYIYSSSEMAKFYGLTNKAIQFYEEKGLLHPQRIGTGNIRRYDLSDSYSLYYTRLYHNCGVCVNQVVDLLQNNTPDHLCSTLNQHMERMEKEIRFQQHLLYHMQEIQNAFMHALSHPNEFSVISLSEGVYRLYIRHFIGAHTSNTQETEELQNWNRLLPIACASMLFPQSHLNPDTAVLDTQIGLMIRESDFNRFDLKHSKRISYHPAGRFGRGVISCDHLLLNDPQCLSPVLSFIQENGLSIRGDAFTRMLNNVKTESGCIRYDEIYIPIE